MSKNAKTETNRKVKRVCPVCGKAAKLTAHHILPRFIFKEIKTDDRAFFLNGDNSYCLCRNCHDKYEQNVNNLKNRLLKNLYFPKISLMPFVLNTEFRKVKNLCRFMTGKFSINSYNYSIYEAYDFVKKYHNKQYLEYDEIIKWAEIDEIIPNEKYINIGNFLIEKLGVKELDSIFRSDLRKFLQKRNRNEMKNIPERNKYYEI